MNKTILQSINELLVLKQTLNKYHLSSDNRVKRNRARLLIVSIDYKLDYLAQMLIVDSQNLF